MVKTVFTSTGQQLSISFAVAVASLVTALFVPDRFHTTPGELLHGIHEALAVLGVATIVSTLVFRGLEPGDGSAVSRHREARGAA